jgi:transcriptional regulator with XRE-family HTH domain
MTRDEIRDRRMRLKLSQLALARRARVSRYKVWAYEAGSGTLNPDEISRIAEVFRDEATHIRQRLAPLGV